MPSGDEVELGFLNQTRDGYVLGIKPTEGVVPRHLLIMLEGNLLSSHITRETTPKEWRHLSEFDFREIPKRFSEKEVQKLIKPVPSSKLSENVLYISQDFINWMRSLQSTFFEKRVESKKIIHLLNFKKLADRSSQLVGELIESPSSYLGICKSEELLEDSSKFGFINSGLVLMPLENQLYTLDFSFILNPNAKSSNIFAKIYRATGFNQYMQEIERDLDKLLSEKLDPTRS
jgi:hypothetical protein